MSLAGDLDKALKAAGVPVVSVIVKDEQDRASWGVQLGAGATPAQEATAMAILGSFDPTTIAVVALPPVSEQPSTGLTAEQVLGWVTNQLGLSYADALKDIAKGVLPPVAAVEDPLAL